MAGGWATLAGFVLASGALATPTPPRDAEEVGGSIDLWSTEDQAVVTLDAEDLVEAGEVLGGDPLVDCVVHPWLEAWEVVEIAGVEVVDDGAAVGADRQFAIVHCIWTTGEDRWFVWEIGDPPPSGVGELLALSARARVRVPGIEPVSAPDGFDIPYLAQLPIWLWVDDGVWVPIESSAEIEVFGLAASLRATPTVSSWFVDGELVATCDQGVEWERSLEHLEPACGVTFTEVAEHELSVVVSYDVELSCVPADLCDGVTLDPIRGVSSRSVRVVEAWGAVISPGG